MLIFMNILEMYLKVISCVVNEYSNLHIAHGTYNPKKITKKWSTYA
jgi:hypothetical protein